jgi:hypothetical protein
MGSRQRAAMDERAHAQSDSTARKGKQRQRNADAWRAVAATATAASVLLPSFAARRTLTMPTLRMSPHLVSLYCCTCCNARTLAPSTRPELSLAAEDLQWRERLAGCWRRAR